ncbi:MAG: tRNA-dihydrouridine synthase family protein [Muribaculaceae bacterium]|nr:tRNA-dihydrouridine synthase family protein [Muribaculaceae bacterium]
MDDFKIMFAPLQGFTEASYRHLHATLAGGIEDEVEYFTPFLRMEHGEVRRRDLADLITPLNDGLNLTPQIIFKDAAEFKALAHAVVEAGYDRVDLNLGCPFVPQVRKGRGAGMLQHPGRLTEVAEAMDGFKDRLQFSVKMRLGVNAPAEWNSLTDIINAMPLRHVAVHPRTASQQYGGTLVLSEFEAMAEVFVHPLVFNGDITEPAQIDALRSGYPWLKGVMIGRGLLMRPSIADEWRHGREYSAEERRALALRLHRALLDHYRATLCGDAQVLSKISPWAEWLECVLDRRTAKHLLKTGSLANYISMLPL